MFIYQIDIAYDDEVQKFYVARSDIKGLHVEAKTIEEMRRIVQDVAPDLFKANSIPLHVHARAFLRGVVAPSVVHSDNHVGPNLRLAQDLCIA